MNEYLKGKDLNNALFYIKNNKLTEQFIEENKDDLNWKHIVKWIDLSEPFIEKFADRLTWDYILLYQTQITDEFILKHKNDFKHWDYLGVYRETSIDLAYKILDKINWPAYSAEGKMSEDFMREFKDKLDWTRVTMGYANRFSDQFIREMKDYINWYYILRERKKISIDFLREIVNKLLPKTGVKAILKAIGSQLNDNNIPEVMGMIRKYNIEKEVLECAHGVKLSDETIIANYKYFDMMSLWQIRNGNISKKLKKVFDNKAKNQYGL